MNLSPPQLAARARAYMRTLDPVAIEAAQNRLQIGRYKTFQAIYRNNPALFLQKCIDWKRIGDSPTHYQIDIASGVQQFRKVAVRGPRGLGKTFMAAGLIHWFALTRDGHDSHDWKIITTAGSSNQLTAFLWPEIRKVARMLRWDVIGRAPYSDGGEMLQQNINLKTGSAMAISPKEPELMEGAHAHSMFYVYDEAKSIADGIFDSSEGAFSGAGPDTGREAFALAISTPGKPTGRFHAIHTKKAGLESWKTIHVKNTDAIKAKRISQEWVDRVKRQWGENSALYQNHVLGEFATGSTDSVIPLAWLEAANERWMALKAMDRLPKPKRWTPEERMFYAAQNEDAIRTGKDLVEELLNTSIGADCAYGGKDLITIAERCGLVTTSMESLSVSKHDLPTTVTAGRVQHIHNMRGGMPVVDVVGVGGGAVDQLRRDGCPVAPFSAGTRAEKNGMKLMDETKTLGFNNLRSASWWHFRTLLDPKNGFDVAIPPDEEVLAIKESDSSLMAELLAPTWSIVGVNIVVESKDELRKPDRLGHSTDWADAVIQAYALELLSSVRQPGDIGMS